MKGRLRVACMDQKQIEEAPATALFLGDRRVAANNFAKMLGTRRRRGTASEVQGEFGEVCAAGVSHGAGGVGVVVEGDVAGGAAAGAPMLELPAIHRRYWLAKQVSLIRDVVHAGGDGGGAGDLSDGGV